MVGVSGAAAGGLLELLCLSQAGSLEQLPVGEARFAGWRHRGSTPTEPVVLVRTAADCWEVHAHGGRAVADSIVSGLCTAGGVACSVQDWPGTFARPADSSLERRLAAAGGWRSAQLLSRQLAGQFDAAVRLIEHHIAATDRSPAADLLTAKQELERLARAARIGLRLPTPWRVVLRGAVNVGKSTLVNALAGYARSLVSPLAGTTRDLLKTRLVLDGWEIELVDTAGETRRTAAAVAAVEHAGIEKGRAAAQNADLVLELTPAANLLEGSGAIRGNSHQRLVVATKADLLPPEAANATAADSDVILTSALTGSGIDQLAEAIIHRLLPEAAAGDLDYGVPVTSQQLQQVERLRLRLDQLLKTCTDLTPDLSGPEPEA